MSEQPIVCAYHPNRPTALRCNRCSRPICAACAVRTPVGYRCRTCVHEQQKIYETALWYDFPIAFIVSGVICGVGSILGSMIGFFILFVAAFVGSIAARAVNWAVRHRRSRFLWLASAAGGIFGCLPAMLPTFVMILIYLYSGHADGVSLLTTATGLLWPAGYMIVAVGALIASMRGLRLG